MKRALLLAAVALGLATVLPLLHAQEVLVSVTNTTVYIWFHNLKVLVFNTTQVRIGWLNVSYIRIAYSCLFSSNYSEECTALEILVNGSSVKTFVPSASICNTEMGYCYDYVDVKFTGSALNITILRYPTRELIDTIILSRPTPFINPQVGADLLLLVPLGLLIAFTARASLKGCGLGAIIYGIAVAAMGALGIAPRGSYFIAVIAIVIGGVLIYVSR